MPRSPTTRASLLSSAEAAEAAFYDAFQQGDVEAMMQVWAEDEEPVCIHPGGPRLVGAAAIRAGFGELFASGGVRIVAERVLRNATLGSAVHNVVERVRVDSGNADEEFALVLATNVYLKTPDGWRLVLHHASPATVHEAAEVLAGADRLH